ncbi:MAG TPA: hypothetical protein VMV10_07905 [Pirellulales bacterium]|nr:hypothetical protein [Pirellulales bacterium]
MEGDRSNTSRGKRDGGFDFNFHVGRLCADLAARLPELSHVDMSRVAIRYCQARSAASHGLQATLTPLRFEGGELFTQRCGRRWTIERLYDASGREMLYLLSFYLPRFLNHSFEEKLTTVIHELWHISPSFNGDLRRLPGRCYAHGPSEREYHQQMEALAAKWLSFGPPEETFRFLHASFRQLQSSHGAVFGARISTPRLIPADHRAA